AGEVADAGEFLPFALALLDLFPQRIGRLRIAVQPVVQVLREKPCNELTDTRALGAEVTGAEFRFGLGLEHGFLHADRHRGHDRLADVGGVVVLLEEIAHRADDTLAEGGEVRAAHRRVLAVDEGVVLLAVVAAVGHRDLDVLRLEVYDRVQRLTGQFLREQVFEALLRFEGLAVERQREPAVEVRVVPQHVLDEVGAELEIGAEELLVGGKLDVGAVLLVARLNAMVLLELAAFELDELALAVAHRLRAVGYGEGVDGLLANTVETDRFLECLAVVLGTGVDDRDAVDELAERNAAAEVAHTDRALGEVDLDLLAVAHRELVDRVIDRLLEQHVNAVLGMGAIAQPADVHAGPQPDVLEGGEGLDGGFGVIGCGHGYVEPTASDRGPG